jgi:hypothetical protein
MTDQNQTDVVGSKMPTFPNQKPDNSGYGNNGFQSASSTNPGEHVESGFAKTKSAVRDLIARSGFSDRQGVEQSNPDRSVTVKTGKSPRPAHSGMGRNNGSPGINASTMAALPATVTGRQPISYRMRRQSR